MDSKQLQKWIWLSELIGSSAESPQAIIDYFGSINSAVDSAMAGNASASPLRATAAASQAARQRAQTIINECQARKISVVSFESEHYPILLKSITPAPAVLYVTGKPEALSMRSVSGVGTRRITAYGKQATAEVFRPLARAGLSLVSGLAHGIDAEVHKAAINEGGATVAVMGNPINETYPAQHAELRRIIEQNGAVVSEYPPLPSKYNKSVFPRRNRIIAGMSEILAVIECAEKSGTMTTVNWANDFGREVFALPGRITDSMSVGCNRLIADGASVLTSANDILYRMGISNTAVSRVAEKRAALAGPAKAIMLRLTASPATEEELSLSLGIPETELLPLLSELEINNYVTRRFGRYEAR